MTNNSKAIVAALLLALPPPVSAGPRDEPHDRDHGDRPHAYAYVVGDDDGDTIQVDGAPGLPRIARLSGSFLGLRLLEITPELRAHFGASRDAGVLVAEVEKDSPAAKAGIEVGDVLTSIDGERVTSSWELSRTVRRKDAGETVRLELTRNRGTKTVTAKLEERPRREVYLGDLGRELGRNIRRNVQIDLDRELGRNFGRDLGRDIGRDVGRDFAGDFTREIRIHPRISGLDSGSPREVRRLREKLTEIERRLNEIEKRKK